MRTTFTALMLLSSLALVACSSGTTTDSGGAAAKTVCATCASGKAGEAIWCRHCNAGYVSGEKIACQGCFAAKTGGPPCPTCSAK